MQVRLSTMAGIVVAIAILALLVSVFLVRLADPDRDLYPVRGIDVSHHQGPIDWQQVATGDVDFAFIKATEGRDFSDPQFEINWRRSKSAGIARGAYHFFTFCSPGLDQAKHFLSVVPPEIGALVPAVDVEFSGNCSSYEDLETVQEELAIFLVELERAWKRKPILYLTFRSKFQIADARFDAYPVWLRNVYWRLPSDASAHWIVWQHADDGEVPGIAGPVDRNVLHPRVTVASLQVGADAP